MIVPGSAPGHIMASTPAIRSTPKTTAAQRFRARYIANSTPTFSPKKKLDFEFHDSSDTGLEHENNMSSEASPKLRSRSIFCQADEQQPMTPSSSRSFSSYLANGESEPDFANNSSSATIKPVSLASKFDCFSDSD